MQPHWHNEDGPLCEQHADGIEPDYNSNETDSPANCVVCGRPCAYTLTEAGVQYVIEYLIEAIEEWPAKAEPILASAHPTVAYYNGMPWVAIERDWAEDLKNYGLSRKDKFIVDHFLTLTRAASA